MEGISRVHPIASLPRFPAAVAWMLGAVLACSACSEALAAGAFPSSEAIFPATTRGWVSISHGPDFHDRFDRTQYGQLIKDPCMQPFIQSVRKQIETSNGTRLGRLGLTLDDLLEVSGGELAAGAVEAPTGKIAAVLLVDTSGRDAEARGLIERMHKRMVDQKGTAVQSAPAGPLAVYQLPPANDARGDVRTTEQKVAFALVGAALVVGDDPALIAQIIGTLGQGRGDCIGSLPAYGAVMTRCQGQVPARAATVRWFADPLKFAKA